MRLFLTGFMGSGKTFWGSRLAAQHGFSHIDLDQYIEHAEQSSISELFNKQGEHQFRLIEHNYLMKIIDENEHFIMSTGGGTPCFHLHHELLLEKGIVIYLKADTEFLLKRLNEANSSRPLLSGYSETELANFIERTLEKRRSYYESAHHIIEAHSADDAIFDEILSKYA